MKILIVGSGGREHALAWKAAQSPRVSKVYVAPGNAGTGMEAKLENVPIKEEDIKGLINFAKTQDIGFTLVGPEAPLVAGIVDEFQAAGLRCFGPSRAAARLEGSKAFTKDFLKRHHIPSADYQVFTDLDEATDYIHNHPMPLVIKADGLAAGKGVIIARIRAEAIGAVQKMLSGKSFGEAGRLVVLEDFLEGEEVSFTCMVDGEHVLPLATSQDHKARDDGDTGPNTGGMGAYSPAPVITPGLHDRIMEEIIRPTVAGLAAEGCPYTGFLYAGLMIDHEGNPKVLEYNCRFGDPETQPIIMRLQSSLVDLCEAALEGRLDKMKIKWDPRPALCVVMVANGYPEGYEKGKSINYLPPLPSLEQRIFHAGTAMKNGKLVTNGGRVLSTCAIGRNVTDAQAKAYRLARQIHWEDAYYRTDIGYRAVERET